VGAGWRTDCLADQRPRHHELGVEWPPRLGQWQTTAEQLIDTVISLLPAAHV